MNHKDIENLFQVITSSDVVELNEKLKNEIENALKSIGSNRVFCRLSSRSPKDACDKPGKIRQRLMAELSNELETLKPFKTSIIDKSVQLSDKTSNQCLIILRKCFFKAMAVDSIEEVCFCI